KPPPFWKARFCLNIHPSNCGLDRALINTPPPSKARLARNEHLTSDREASLLKIAIPPPRMALFPVNKQSLSTNFEREIYIPPPSSPDTETSLTVIDSLLNARPEEIVKPSRFPAPRSPTAITTWRALSAW